MVVRQKLPFGLCWLSIARGPVGVVWQALWAEILQLAKREKAVFVRVELPHNSPLEHDPGFSAKAGWRPAHAHHYPDWTLELDLKLSLEEILAQMKQKGRYNIKVAEKSEVTIRAARRAEDVAEFYKILQSTGGRDGFGIHAEAYYQALVKAGHEGKWGTLYVAEKKGEGGTVMVAGIFVTFYGDTATYYYGASAHQFRAMMSPYLLQWTAIQEAKRRGCEWYDFLGVAPPEESPDHPWKGITEFKEKFGGVRIKYPGAKEFVVRPLWYAVMRWVKKLRR